MKSILTSILIALILLPMCNYAQTNYRTNTVPGSQNEYVQGDVLIKFKSIPGQRQAVAVAKQQLISKYKSKVVKQWRMGAEHWKVDTLLPGYNLLKIIDSLNANPFVEYAEPNYIIRADVIPNDSLFGDQWALNNTGQNGGTADADIDAPEAWDITTGDTNIVVGVLDSGIDYNHPDLQDNIWTNWDEIPDNGIDDDNNGYIDDIHGWDFHNNDNDPMDDFGHGTHVAGTIGAVGNNGIGVTGVVWNVRMMALKFLGASGFGFTSDAISAIEYANNMGVKITNNSWSGGGYSQTLFDIIATADTLGALFIAAAGNSSSDNDVTPNYPASYNLDNIISVASTNRNDSLSTFSCYGLNTVDVTAPGTNILSTKPNNLYTNKDGTSMATPHVSGAVVLAWNQFPGFTHTQVKSQILGSSENINELNGKVLTGGRLNLANAVGDTAFFVITTDDILMIGAQYLDSITYKQIIITNMFDDAIEIDSLWVGADFQLSLDNISFSDTLFSIIISEGQSLTVYISFKPSNSTRYEEYLKIFIHNALKQNYTRIVGYGIIDGTITCPNSGEWTAENSPYYINGDFSVSSGYSLKIHPGVEVLFTGYYDFRVHNSHLVAIGLITDSIIFRPLETDIGWKGFSFYGGTLGLTDTLKYCSISYAKKKIADGPLGGGIDANSVNLVVENCEIFNNVGRHGGGIYFVKGDFIFRNLNIHHNQAVDLGGTGSGGGFCSLIQPLTRATMDSIILSNNHAVEIGGAFWLWRGEYSLSNIQILNNNCDGEYTTAFTQCDVNIENMLISGNDFSPNNSWTSVFSMSVATINNLTFVNNGGTLRFYEGQNNLKNSIVYNGSLPEISVKNIDNFISTLNIQYSSISDSLNSFDLINSQINMTDMTFGNPNFISTTDVHLADNSFCIDGGDPSDDVRNEPFPHGYKINMGYYGGTNEAAPSSGMAVNFQPSPIDLGKISVYNIYHDTLWIMNGGTVNTIIENIINHDTNHLDLIYNQTIDTLFPGQVFPVEITFDPSSLTEGLYQSIVEIVLSDTTSFSIPVYSEVYTGTVIDSLNVHGIWYQANSPYKIINNIKIPNGKSLIIEPGVHVYFGGDFNFTIGQNSTLLGKGNTQDSIVFKPYLVDSWSGISFINSGDDDTLSFIHLENAGNFQKSGGGFFIDNSSPLISNAFFYMCKAYEGGAMYINNSILQLNNCVFKNNVAGNKGGALSLDSSTIYLTKCDFINNDGTKMGGGIAMDYSSLIGDRIYASGNNSNFSSFLEGYSSYDINISNSVFCNNFLNSYSSGDYQALFRVMGYNYKFYNTTISNNYDKVFLCGPRANILFSNCIVWGNIQPQIDIDPYYLPYSNTNLTIQNCDIENGENSINFGDEIIHWGTGNIDVLPEFLDSTYALASNSPCIDAGLNDSVFSSIDIDGNLRIWDGDGNDTATVDMGAYEYGAPQAQFQEIELSQGWNNFSGNVDPVLKNMINVLRPLIDSSQLVKAIDEAGGIVQYIPGVGWLNTIGNMENTEGYYIKTTQNTNLSLVGEGIVTPFSIPLQTGWNNIGYPLQNNQDAMAAFQPLIDSTHFVKAINEAGGLIQFIPGIGWINTIDSLAPGEGYYIRVIADDTLILTETGSKSLTHNHTIQEGQYYLRNTTGNPYMPMHIVARFSDIEIEEGDELGVFVNNECIGSAILTDLNSPLLAFLSTDDPTTSNIDGGVEGDMLSFKLYHNGEEHDLICTNSKPEDLLFEPLQTKIITLTTFALHTEEEIMGTYYVSEVIPNPFSTKARIYVTIPESGNLKVELLDLRGVAIRSLFKNEVNKGNMEIAIHASGLTSGMYFVLVYYESENNVDEILRKVVINNW